MPERKKTRTGELREVFLAYESAMSPVVLPLVLGFAGYWICESLNQPIIIGIITGSALGFIIGLRRLVIFLKKINTDSAKKNSKENDENSSFN